VNKKLIPFVVALLTAMSLAVSTTLGHTLMPVSASTNPSVLTVGLGYPIPANGVYCSNISLYFGGVVAYGVKNHFGTATITHNEKVLETEKFTITQKGVLTGTFFGAFNTSFTNIGTNHFYRINVRINWNNVTYRAFYTFNYTQAVPTRLANNTLSCG